MNDRWPLHPKPNEHEFLSQWVRRIAQSYEISYQVFCLRVLKIDDIKRVHLDESPCERALEILALGTGQRVECLREMTSPGRRRRIAIALKEGDVETLALYAKRDPYLRGELWRLGYKFLVDQSYRCDSRSRCRTIVDQSGKSLKCPFHQVKTPYERRQMRNFPPVQHGISNE